MAMRLIASTQRELGTEVRLPVVAVFDYPSIRQLCAHLGTLVDPDSVMSMHPLVVSGGREFRQSLMASNSVAMGTDLSSSAVGTHLEPGPRLEMLGPANSAFAEKDQYWVLSLMQEQMWTLFELNHGPQYNISMVIRLHGELERHALCAALAAVVSKHDILKTVYKYSMDGGAVQQVDRLLMSQVPILPAVVAADLAAGQTWLKHVHGATLELETAGPLQYHTLQLNGTNEHLLLLIVHHIAFDGMSLAPLMADLAAAYDTAASGAVPELVELPVQYLDWAAWHRATLEWGGCEGCGRGSALEQGLSYWRTVLRDGDLPVLEMDLGTHNPTVSAASVPDRVPIRVAAGLADIAALVGTTPMHAALSAWAGLLHWHTGQTEVVIGFPYAHREHRLLMPLVGYFVNTLAALLSLIHI